MTPVPINSHESNGLVKRAKHKLKSYYNLLWACYQQSPTTAMIQETAFSNKIIRGSNILSSFELKFGRSPRVSGDTPTNLHPVPTIEENTKRITRSSLKYIIRTNTIDPERPNISDSVIFWIDIPGWIGPSIFTKVDHHGGELFIAFLSKYQLSTGSGHRRLIQCQTYQVMIIITPCAWMMLKIARNFQG